MTICSVIINEVNHLSKQKERFETMRTETIEKIMYAATILFARKTFFKTTMQDIADGASVSKGLAYRYFSSKEEIMNQLIELEVQNVDNISKLFQREGDEKEILIQATKFLLENLIEDSSTADGFLLLSQIESFSENELNPDVKSSYECSLKNLINVLADLISSGQKKGYFKEGNPQELAFFCYSSFQGVAFTSRSFKEDYIFPTVEVFLKFLIK
jgi:TetR/AcrR family transcriptional regulator, acrAB operon repressor